MLKYIIIIVLLLIGFTRLDQQTQDRLLNLGRQAGDTAEQTITGVIDQYPSTNSDGTTNLGVLPSGENCFVDLECQEMFSCSGCSCNNQTGECWY